MLAITLGYRVARYESPIEIKSNDLQLKRWTLSRYTTSLISSITAQTPQACLRYHQFDRMDKVANASKALSQLSLETDPIERLKLILQLNSSFIPEVPTSINNGLYNYMKSDDNNNTMKAEFDVAVMYDFLMDCAAQIGSGMLRLLESNLVGAHSDTPVLTFGWNRCTPTALNNTILKQIVGNIEVIRPPKQQQFYTKTWIEDQQQLFDHYFDIQYHQNNRSYPIADFLAFNASVQLATGKTACEVNTYSGGIA